MEGKINRMAMNESGFIFDPQTGMSYTTNITGMEILNKLKETDDIDKVCEYIVDEFEVSQEEAERDIQDFVELLKSRGMLD